jgi:hypothetical protein
MRWIGCTVSMTNLARRKGRRLENREVPRLIRRGLPEQCTPGPNPGRFRWVRLSPRDLRGFGSGSCNFVDGVMARSRRLECHTPVQRAVGTILQSPRPAEMEIRMPRLTDRPAAVVLLKVEQFLPCRRLLSPGLGLRCHDILPTVESLRAADGNSVLGRDPRFGGDVELASAEAVGVSKKETR